MVLRQSHPKTAFLHQHPNGTVHALSSDQHTVYVVRIGADSSCSCPAGINGRRCYHVATAEQRYAAYYPRPLAVVAPVSDSEPPTPTAPAAMPTRRACACDLYPETDCDCRQQRAA